MTDSHWQSPRVWILNKCSIAVFCNEYLRVFCISFLKIIYVLRLKSCQNNKRRKSDTFSKHLVSVLTLRSHHPAPNWRSSAQVGDPFCMHGKESSSSWWMKNKTQSTSTINLIMIIIITNIFIMREVTVKCESDVQLVSCQVKSSYRFDTWMFENFRGLHETRTNQHLREALVFDNKQHDQSTSIVLGLLLRMLVEECDT